MSINSDFNTKEITKDCFKTISRTKQLEEYEYNKKQIECISKVLIESANVPPLLIDWLIESVQKNTAIKYEYFKNSN